MFCPECRCEFRPGFERCADCGADLVHELPAGDTEDWVPVLKTTDPSFLPVAKSVLEAAGIIHLVQGEAGVTVFPLGPAASQVTNRLTGAMILVRARDAEEAEALLRAPAELPDDEA